MCLHTINTITKHLLRPILCSYMHVAGIQDSMLYFCPRFWGHEKWRKHQHSLYTCIYIHVVMFAYKCLQFDKHLSVNSRAWLAVAHFCLPRSALVVKCVCVSVCVCVFVRPANGGSKGRFVLSGQGIHAYMLGGWFYCMCTLSHIWPECMHACGCVYVCVCV